MRSAIAWSAVALFGLVSVAVLASTCLPASASLRPTSTASPTLACTQLDPLLAAAKPSTEGFGTLARRSLADGCVAYIDTSTSPPSLELAFLRGSLTGTVIVIGALRTASGSSVDLTDVALTSSGTLYGVDFGSDLYRIDTTNAVATLVGPLSAQVNGLVVSPEGSLYASGGFELYTVNLSSGSATYVGTTGYASSGDLAFTPDGKLLMSAEPGLGGPNDSLVNLNLTTAYGTLVGSIGQGSVYGLAESYGTLFGATTSGELLTVDPSTGAATVLAAGGDLSANGMAVPPQATAPDGRTPPAVPTVAITSSKFFSRGGSERGSVVLSCAHASCSGEVRLTRVVGSPESPRTQISQNNNGTGKTHSEVLASTRYELSPGATRAFPLTFTALGSRLARQGPPTALQGTLVVSVKGGPYATSGVDVTGPTSGSADVPSASIPAAPSSTSTSTTPSSISTTTPTTAVTSAGSPQCTLAALTTAALAAGVPNVTGVDPQGYGCSGNWAYAGVGLGAQEEVTWVFMAVNGSWQRTDVQLSCQANSSSPTLPPSILQAACNSN